MKNKLFKLLGIPLFKKGQIFDSPYGMFRIHKYYKQIKGYGVFYIFIKDESKQLPIIFSEVELEYCILFTKLN